MDFPFHVRAIDQETGVTLRQLPQAFKTFDEAQRVATRETQREALKHDVCISLDPKDPRNPRGDENAHRQGYAVFNPDTHGDLLEAKPATLAKAPTKRKKA